MNIKINSLPGKSASVFLTYEAIKRNFHNLPLIFKMMFNRWVGAIRQYKHDFNGFRPFNSRRILKRKCLPLPPFLICRKWFALLFLAECVKPKACSLYLHFDPTPQKGHKKFHYVESCLVKKQIDFEAVKEEVLSGSKSNDNRSLLKTIKDSLWRKVACALH